MSKLDDKKLCTKAHCQGHMFANGGVTFGDPSEQAEPPLQEQTAAWLPPAAIAARRKLQAQAAVAVAYGANGGFDANGSPIDAPVLNSDPYKGLNSDPYRGPRLTQQQPYLGQVGGSLLDNVVIRSNVPPPGATDMGQGYYSVPVSSPKTGKIFKEEPVLVKYDAGKPDYSLLPLWALEGVVKVMMYGAQKYSRDGWQQGSVDDVKRYEAAALRHRAAIQSGQVNDPESGLRHADHELCSMMMARGLQLKSQRIEEGFLDASAALAGQLDKQKVQPYYGSP
jgi:hypothetical protein